MSDQINQINNPIAPAEEDVVEPAITLSDLGRKIFKGDKVVWSVFIILCVISLVEIFSATSTIVYRHQNIWALFSGTPCF